MNDSTTETDPPVWPPAPAVPDPTSVTRDSAVAADKMAAELLDGIALYRMFAADALARDIPITRDILDEVSEVRRRVVAVADLLARRRLSRPSMTDGLHAYRLAERVAGQVLAAGQRAGVIRSRATAGRKDLPGPVDFLGHSVERCRQMATGTDDEFDAAIDATRAMTSGPAYDYVLSELQSGELSEAAQERRALLRRLADAGNTSEQIGEVMAVTPYRVGELARQWGVTIPADEVTARAPKIDPARVVESLLPILAGAAASARLVDDAVIKSVDPSQAADWASALWDVCVPLVGLQNALKLRGKA